MSHPALSIVVASDYAPGGRRNWESEHRVLAALGPQVVEPPCEILLVVRPGEVVPETIARAQAVRVIETRSETSRAQKFEAAALAKADLIACIDADCTPAGNWCHQLLETLHRVPEAAVVTGRTTYAGNGLRNRLLGLMDRGDLDPGMEGFTRWFAATSFGIRRSVMLQLQTPAYPPVFNSLLYASQLRRAGHRIWFNPRVRCVHELSGWDMEADIRRNVGHAVVAQRRADGSIAYAWMAQLGLLSIPVLVGARTLHEWQICLANWRHYGVRRYEVPLALALSVFLRGWEVQGMWQALRNRPIQRTAYH